MRRQQKKIDQGKSVEQSIPSQAVEKSGSKNPGSSSSKPPRAGVHSSVSTVHADRSNSDTSSSRSVDSRGHVDPSSAHQTSSSSNPSHKKSSSKKHVCKFNLAFFHLFSLVLPFFLCLDIEIRILEFYCVLLTKIASL